MDRIADHPDNPAQGKGSGLSYIPSPNILSTLLGRD
jgi:hypothetical protein